MPSVDWQLSFCHAITGVCTPACLLAASISVEAVTPPLVGLAFTQRTTSRLGCPSREVNVLDDVQPSMVPVGLLGASPLPPESLESWS